MMYRRSATTTTAVTVEFALLRITDVANVSCDHQP